MDPATLAQRIAQMQTELAAMSARVTELLAQQAAQAAAGHGADALTMGLTVFVLACFVGYYVVWNVTPALHSPLMAVTNAISSVIIVGALLAAGLSSVGFSETMGFLAVVLASVNIFGGFVVTQRMLGKFRKRETAKGRH
ncbi:MAG: NAD(P) transhydrogenase subunit alpha [Alphaproteobacteria bacterium]|nr:NAD(P) transhydrogenase subunit alpha [Alphaproteobacteria bacterium]